MLLSTFILSTLASAAAAQLSESNMKTFVGSLSLSSSFNPIMESYWTGLPHHRRTPFCVSPDGKSAYLAYLDASGTGVHIQQVDPSTFAAVGTAVTVSGGKEAGGLVCQDDGFALLTNEVLPAGTANAPSDDVPVAALYRYTSGKQTWKTFLGGPSNVGSMGALASPDLNGDLAYSPTAKMYGAYFVVTAYSGSAKGHFGDAIMYVTEDGTLKDIPGASSDWGCSHNTGILFEAADAVPFASMCSEDQGAIWLNSGDTGMSNTGVKVSNENVQNGAGNEAFGGMSGSYSGLARFIGKDGYITTWVSRGAKNLSKNDWMGDGYTKSENRTVNRNVAIAMFSDKKTIVGEEATSTLGGDGDKQINWITTGSADCQNAHVAAFDGSSALVTWEEIAEPTCEHIAMGCKGAFTGAYYQLVKDGKKVGTAIKSMDVFVAGDMVTMSDGRVCWPYVDMDWKLDGPVRGSSVNAISFACMGLTGANTSSPVSENNVSVQPASSSAAVAVTSNTPASSSAAATPAPEQYSSAPADSALPSFAIVTSGATIEPPSTPAPAVTTPPAVTSAPAPSSYVDSDLPAPYDSSIQLPASQSFDPVEAPGFTPSPVLDVPVITDLPVYSSAPCDEDESSPSEVPSVPSAAPPAGTPTPQVPSDEQTYPTPQVPSDEQAEPSSPATPAATPTPEEDDDLPCEDEDEEPTPSASAAATPADAAIPLPSSGSVLPPYPTGDAPFPTGTGAPYPSGTGRPGRPSSRPSGRPDFSRRPRPSRGPRPTGANYGPEKYDFGLGAKAASTPCTFETRVKPEPTGEALV